MADFFSTIKEKIKGLGAASEYEDIEKAADDYVELDTDVEDVKSKIIIRPFILDDFENIRPILDCLREGRTVALVNIKPLKEKDLVELKRAINKIKKTTDAIEGEIAGFGDDYIVVTPSFAQIYRTKQTQEVKEEATPEGF